MSISQTVMGYLDRHDVDFDVVTHRHTASSSETARAADIMPRKLAKGVLMLDADDYVLAVVPGSRRVNPYALRELALPRDDAFGSSLREPLFFADESDMPFIFRDCERGALPAIGSAFGVTTVIDDDLLRRRDVYFEAGDHEHLIHMSGYDFNKLMLGQAHGFISY